MAAVAAPAKAPATTYAEAVAAGEIIAGPLVRAACARHLRDLEHGHKRGLWFDEVAADRAIRFFGFLRLAEGEFAGQPFTLQPWQQFIIGSLFGWKGADGYRRFRKAYIEIGKGNGKSPMAAGIGLYGLVADGEAGAEIYSAAVTRDQAGILFTDAKRMVEASPHLSGIVEVGVHNLAVPATNSFFRPVSSEARSLDGKRVYIALIDEVHEHRSSLVIDKVQAGTKGRRQPLIVEITNSGYDRTSVCWQHHEYSAKILDGVVDDDGWFAYVCGLDAGDDYADPAVWLKANPNLGVSITHKYLQEQVREAQAMPGRQNIVRRLNFCEWTEQADRWLDLVAWDDCGAPVNETALTGRMAFAGLDLASTTDLSAFLIAVPSDDGSYDLVCRFWCPEEGIRQRSRRDRVPYDVWARQGYLTPTSGNIVDYDLIREEIKSLAERFDLREIAYDRWNATQLVTQLGSDGATVVPFGQGFASMSAPAKELEKLVIGGKLRHGGHPILRWMAANVAIAQDPAGNIKPAKDKSTERIDGIVALVMALGRAIVYENQGTGVPTLW